MIGSDKNSMTIADFDMKNKSFLEEKIMKMKIGEKISQILFPGSQFCSNEKCGLHCNEN